MRLIDRLDKYMSLRELNDNQLTVNCGLSVGLLGKARKGKSDIGKKAIDKILNFYQDLNKYWLLTGEGEMLKNGSNETVLSSENENSTTLLLPIAAQAGRLNDFIASIKKEDCETVISPIKNIDFALRITGDSMAPEYPNGAQIFVKKINEKAFVEWGRVYVLDTCNGTIIKKILPGVHEESYKCESINTNYPTFEINTTDVYGMYRVLLCMAIK